jgi:hypothetical protein
LLKVAEPAVEAAYLDRWGRLPELRHEIIISGASERDALELEHAALMARLSASPDPDDFAKLQANAAARAALDEQPTTRTVRTVATGRTRADAWASATPEDRRDLLKDAYEYITCHPRSVRPRLVFTERPEVSELSVDEFGDVM